MPTKITLFITLLVSGPLFGQGGVFNQEELFLTALDSGLYSRNLIWMGFDYYANSNAITNSFINASLFDGFIGEDEKVGAIENLQINNRLGVDFSTELGYRMRMRAPGWTMLVKLKDREHMNMGFNEKTFELILRGNKHFAGTAVKMDRFNYTYFNYQQFYLGAEKYDQDGQSFFGFGASVLKGSRYQHFSLDRANLFTEADGTYIDFDVALELAHTDEVDDKWSALQGVGTSVDFYYVKRFQQTGNILSVALQDVGAIWWQDATAVKADSSYRFEGIVVDDIFQWEDSLFSSVSTDSIADILGVEQTKENNAMVLPTSFTATYAKKHSDRFRSLLGFHYLFGANYWPRFQWSGYYTMNRKKDFLTSMTVTYGGFSRVDVAVGLAKQFAAKYTLTVNAFYLENLISPASSSGQAVSARFSARF